jgi:hypothetical protein
LSYLRFKPITGFRVLKRNILAKVILDPANLFGGFGKPTEEITADQVIRFCMKGSILAEIEDFRMK